MPRVGRPLLKQPRTQPPSTDQRGRAVSLESAPPPRRYATRILPLIRLSPRHQLLVSLLLLNAIANEAMPLFLDKLVPPWAAILISVTAVLFVGEIIPAAVFTGPAKMRSVYALFPPPAAGQIRCSLLTQLLRRSRIAALLSPLAWFIVMLSSPISYPLGWALRRPLPTRTARNLPRHFPAPGTFP